LKSKALPSFWKCFEQLPAEIQELARQKYRLWQQNPFHASLNFKEVRPRIWSIRITQKYRALGQESADMIVWYWIGTHDDYDTRV
jgi:hypothetical protein